MSLRRSTPRACLATLALVSALALAGCGGDTEEPTGGGAASGSASTSADDEPTDPGSSDATPSEEPSASASTPAVAPATGPVMQLDDMSLNAPQGWEISISKDAQQAAFNASGGPGALVVSLLGAVPGESFESTLDGALETMKSDRLKPQRLDDLTLDGVQTWVLTGSKPGIALDVQMGGLAGSDTFSINFQFLTKPPADIQTTIDGVLSTVVFDAA